MEIPIRFDAKMKTVHLSHLTIMNAFERKQKQKNMTKIEMSEMSVIDYSRSVSLARMRK